MSDETNPLTYQDLSHQELCARVAGLTMQLTVVEIALTGVLKDLMRKGVIDVPPTLDPSEYMEAPAGTDELVAETVGGADAVDNIFVDQGDPGDETDQPRSLHDILFGGTDFEDEKPELYEIAMGGTSRPFPAEDDETPADAESGPSYPIGLDVSLVDEDGEDVEGFAISIGEDGEMSIEPMTLGEFADKYEEPEDYINQDEDAPTLAELAAQDELCDCDECDCVDEDIDAEEVFAEIAGIQMTKVAVMGTVNLVNDRGLLEEDDYDLLVALIQHADLLPALFENYRPPLHSSLEDFQAWAQENDLIVFDNLDSDVITQILIDTYILGLKNVSETGYDKLMEKIARAYFSHVSGKVSAAVPQVSEKNARAMTAAAILNKIAEKAANDPDLTGYQAGRKAL